MRAFLLKLNYGLRDLSYMELERHAATYRSPRCGTNPSQKAVSCYFERFGNKCVPAEGTQVRLHVHKEENGVKLGKVCPKQSSLEIIFSIFQCPCGDFILSVVGKLKQRFGLFLLVNDDVLPLDEKGMRVLRHGDIIRGFFSKIPSFRIMFLLSDSSHVRETQTSLLLSCPWLVLKNIAKFLPPFEMMRDVVPVCRQLFHLMRDGSSWTRVEICLRDGMQCPPFGHFHDFCNVVYKLKKLHLNHAILHDGERLRSNLVVLWDPHLRQFPDFLGSGVLSSLHTYQLPVNLSAGNWKLARKMGIFANLESLSMSGEIFNNMPPAKKKIIFFPKLKSLWLEDASPIAACRHFPLMPSLEYLWIRNAVREETSIKPTQEVLQALEVFNTSPIEWLEHLKCVSADVWETYIPYSNMINLECVALFFQHKTVEKSPGGIFKELRSCSQLRGLILKVPDNLPLETLGQLSQPLEFIAFPGTKLNKAWSVLRQLSHCKDSLEDLWIEVCDFKEVKKILRAVKAFKQLKNIVLFSKSDVGSGEGLPETMLGCLGPVSSLYQATFVCEFGPDLRHKYIACDVKQQTSSEFSSRFVTRFYSEWLRLVPNQLVQASFRIMFLLSDGISHVREPQTSLLLSCPWLILKNVMKYLTPFAMMQDVVPVCRLFFDLMKDGSSWTRIEFYLENGMECPPWGHLKDFCNVVYRYVRRLSLKFRFQTGLEPFWPRNILKPIFNHHDWSKLKVLKVLNLDTNEDAWLEFLTRSGKTLTNLEMLSVECVTLGDSLLKSSESGDILFPKCRVVSLRCSLEKMYSANMGQAFPRMEKLYLNPAILHDVANVLSNVSLLRDPFLLKFPDFLGSGVLSSLHTYQLPVKLDAMGWQLAWRMGIFGNLESLSMSGTIFNKMPPVDDEKIIFFPKEIKKILRAVKAFKRLKNVVLLSKSVLGSGEGFLETMKECLGPASVLNQATILCEAGMDPRHVYLTYNAKQQKGSLFSSTFITRFHSEWFKHVPDNDSECHSTLTGAQPTEMNSSDHADSDPQPGPQPAAQSNARANVSPWNKITLNAMQTYATAHQVPNANNASRNELVIALQSKGVTPQNVVMNTSPDFTTGPSAAEQLAQLLLCYRPIYYPKQSENENIKVYLCRLAIAFKQDNTPNSTRVDCLIGHSQPKVAEAAMLLYEQGYTEYDDIVDRLKVWFGLCPYKH
ncbi:unnamed protein product [Notodromas monacha]|uniref:F-box domain-containing protein n=1 Tax=Notodromas monacha TaxID=399045 RepID=A0A7R9BQB6_9CRUS|nr:unnamed protein product [Notodromas monacha]CAG0919678.1 unnamed protein product [Notodromas monacha]